MAISETSKSNDNSSVVELIMEPKNGEIDLRHSALLIIDMQRDFLEGGFGAALGNDVSKLQKAIGPCQRVLQAARQVQLPPPINSSSSSSGSSSGMLILHTREGHRADMADVHAHKNRNEGVIGTNGPCGKILIRGEPGHDIIPPLYPKPGEPIIDKPGKGSFYATDLECILSANHITTLLVCGVTTEVCVHTTVREANDRGYHCIVIADCCASFSDVFHKVALEMITSQRGIFGSVTTSQDVIDALSNSTR